VYSSQSEMFGRIDVDSTPIRRSRVDHKIKSSFFFYFRPTLYLLKTASKSVFPRELSFFFYNKRDVNLMPFWRRNDVKATSSSKFSRSFQNDFVDVELFRPPLRRQIDVHSTNHFLLGYNELKASVNNPCYAEFPAFSWGSSFNVLAYQKRNLKCTETENTAIQSKEGLNVIYFHYIYESCRCHHVLIDTKKSPQRQIKRFSPYW